MKKTEFINGLTRKFNRVGLKLQKHSPEILMVVGVVGTVVSTVMACKATTKLQGVLDETKEKIDMFHQGAEDGKVQSEVNGKLEVVDYTEEDCTRDITITYARTGLELAKLYGPAIIIGAVSITSILAGHNILRKRNVALAAAYTAIDNGFKKYRNNVVERFGKELDQELRFNLKSKEIEEKVVDENGNEVTVKKTVDVVNPNDGISDFARFFDESCPGWTKSPEYNLMFLKTQESLANKMLQERGYLFLNDVYELLGIQKTGAGQRIGWIYDEKNPLGDNYVDFGLYNYNRERVRAFVNGYERVFLVDPNPDGDILNFI